MYYFVLHPLPFSLGLPVTNLQVLALFLAGNSLQDRISVPSWVTPVVPSQVSYAGQSSSFLLSIHL